MGLKSSIKSAFTLYAMVDAEAPVDLYVGLRTEKKLKQKIYTVKPGKLGRLHLNNHGRIFRLEIRCYSAVPFTIAGVSNWILSWIRIKEDEHEYKKSGILLSVSVSRGAA